MSHAIYLSRLVPNLRSREAQRDLNDCIAMHRTLMSAFPDALSRDGSARAAIGLLYRIDTSHDRPFVLVQSATLPNWSNLPSGWVEAGSPPAEKDIGLLIDGVAEGVRLRFKLLANPTKKIGTKSSNDGRKNNGRRVELRGEAEWIAWLERKGEQSGFRLAAVDTMATLADVRTCRQIRTSGLKQLPDGKVTRLTFAGVAFEGRLEVVKTELFQACIRQGIGSGKAYGYGLLSIAPGT